ncbi:MAG: hypothetical protein Q8R35_03845 [bacterium]|nr:hypothetical protein [bacterium]
MTTSQERYLFLAFLFPFLACGIPTLVWLWMPHYLPLGFVGTGVCLGLFGLLIIRSIQKRFVRVDIDATGTRVILGDEKEIRVSTTGKVLVHPSVHQKEAGR